jgi:hypothetical protein
MAMAVSITYVDATGPVIRVGFNLTPSGTYTTGGDTVNLASATQDPAFQGMLPQIEALGAPIDLDIWDGGGNLANPVFPVLGSTQANNKVKVATAFNTELGNAVSYSGNLISGGSKLMGEAVFQKL